VKPGLIQNPRSTLVQLVLLVCRMDRQRCLTALCKNIARSMSSTLRRKLSIGMTVVLIWLSIHLISLCRASSACNGRWLQWVARVWAIDGHHLLFWMLQTPNRTRSISLIKQGQIKLSFRVTCVVLKLASSTKLWFRLTVPHRYLLSHDCWFKST
jgi:hypothetical protein